MRVIMVCRKYSGITDDAWNPAGTPAVVKLIQELERRAHPTQVFFLSKSPAGGRDFDTDYGIFRHVTFSHVGWRGTRALPALLSDMLCDLRQVLRILPALLRGADIHYFDRAHLGLAALVSLFRRNVVWRCLGVMSFVIGKDTGKATGAVYLFVARLIVKFPIALMLCTNDGSPWFRVFRGVSRNRLMLVTNGVDRPATAGTPAGPRRDAPVIGFVGRATLTKGLDTFIAACAELAKRQMAFRAVVIGEGDFLPLAKLMASEAGLADRITFEGRVPHAQIAERFRHIDVYVTPARNGAFSNTTLEAVTAGCCIVALSPAPETGVDRTTHAFLPDDLVSWADRKNAVQSIADILVKVLTDPDKLARPRARALAFGRESLTDWDTRIAKEADLLEALAAGKSLGHGALAGDGLAKKAYEVGA